MHTLSEQVRLNEARKKLAKSGRWATGLLPPPFMCANILGWDLSKRLPKRRWWVRWRTGLP